MAIISIQKLFCQLVKCMLLNQCNLADRHFVRGCETVKIMQQNVGLICIDGQRYYILLSIFVDHALF